MRQVDVMTLADVQPDSFRITMIGAGNLATHLARALRGAGCRILQVYSRTMQSAEALASQVGAVPVCDTGDIDDAANVLIFALADKALPDVIPLVAKRNPHAVMAHTAGSMPKSLFEPYAAHYGVFYPMQTFSKAREVDFSRIPCFVEAADDDTLHTLLRMAALVSTQIYLADSEERRKLHLAAVFACNFANHCYAAAQQLLGEQGIPFEVMMPLIDETADKVHTLAPVDAQTGPAVRFDENVMAAQMQSLDGHPLLREVYEVMSRSIHQTALNK